MKLNTLRDALREPWEPPKEVVDPYAPWVRLRVESIKDSIKRRAGKMKNPVHGIQPRGGRDTSGFLLGEENAFDTLIDLGPTGLNDLDRLEFCSRVASALTLEGYEVTTWPGTWNITPPVPF